MIAKIRNISKNLNDINQPQIDIEVIYVDDRFKDGERLYIFTLPYEEFISLSQDGVVEMIKKQGENFKESLEKGEDTADKEQELNSFIGTEIEI